MKSAQAKTKMVYRCTQELPAEVATRAGKSVITPTAYREAARQWLVKNGLIRIQKAGEVSPNFCQKNDHNLRCRTEGFWSWAKERLIKHHGVSKAYFPLYLKELNFRYNHRNGDIFDLVAKCLCD
jgi:transposase-like protein